MPQFDVFSFYSQLFWVFFCFLFTYLLFSYYLLPALSGILKVRKYKLSQNSEQTNFAVTATQHNAYIFHIQELSKNVISGVSSIETEIMTLSANSTLLGAPIYRFLTTRIFSSTIFTNFQIPAFLLKSKK